MKKAKILIVDDDPAVTNYLMVFLMQTGLFETTVVNDSRDVAGLLEGDPFDIVLLDMDMPNVSGMDILGSMRAKGMDTPVVVLTGVIDGPLTGGVPKAVELFASDDIADLSIYGIGSANNGGGTDGEEFTFPAVSASANTFLYVATEKSSFTNWFGFGPQYVSNAANINGDDAIELFGFPERSELEAFQRLIGVAGVGPRTALAVLSAFTPAELANAVHSGDFPNSGRSAR